jgi:hypothetical protein
VWEEVLSWNRGIYEFETLCQRAPIQTFVMWRDISLRRAAKCLLLMNAHILSHTTATSSGRSSMGLSGIGTPEATKVARHSDASESRASDIWIDRVQDKFSKRYRSTHFDVRNPVKCRQSSQRFFERHFSRVILHTDPSADGVVAKYEALYVHRPALPR